MNLKNRLKNREVTVGSWITIANTVVAEIMATAGYDWLTIDMEHSVITLDAAQDLIRTIDLCGVTPLVRVGVNDATIIKRVMDAGAHGVIVPMVNSREDAEKAVGAVKYPPTGFRGVGLARAQKYGQDFEGYKDWNLNDSIVIAQVEHIDSVNNLEEIIKVDGIDGLIVGPYDLSASLKIPGDFQHPDFLAALDLIKKTAAEHDALLGFHVIQPDTAGFQAKLNEGYKFIAHSLDILFLGNSCRQSLGTIKKMYQ